ncbi:MAG: hypothetical protein ACR2RE_21510, partial [Geminicoccaceae bacterium]
MTVCDTRGDSKFKQRRAPASLRISSYSFVLGAAMLVSGTGISQTEAAPIQENRADVPVIADLAAGSFGPVSAEYRVAEATDGVATDGSAEAQDAQSAHDDLFGESRYPSAATCGTCHPKQYEEWAI